MALSNWDTAAWDEGGTPTNGVFETSWGSVQIYKNWIYVRDPKAWTEGGAYIRPTVMEVQSGSISYKDLCIEAVRGPQNGVYCAVWTPSHFREDKRLKGMLACGVYGFDGEDWVGVKPESLQLFSELITDKVRIQEFCTVYDSVKGKYKEMLNYEADSWDIPDEFRKIDVTKAVRFNQGDAFFAQNLGFDIPCSPPGEAEPTVMDHIIKGIKSNSEKKSKK
jgi:hypothetical protein